MEHSKIYEVIKKSKLSKDIKAKALRSIVKMEKGEYTEAVFENDEDVLLEAFVFSATPEGMAFWWNIKKEIGE